MGRCAKPIRIVMAEDDPEDRLLVRDAFNEAQLATDLYFVEDGEDLIDYLYRRGKYAEPFDWRQPGLILLDLNMPRKGGHEALKEIKAARDLRRIPIVVLTTSKAEEDITRTYDLGVNSYIVKPVTFESLVQVVRALSQYWLETVELPLNGAKR